MIVDDWEVGRRGLMDLFTLHLHCDMEWVWNEESVDMVSNTSLIQVNTSQSSSAWRMDVLEDTG